MADDKRASVLRQLAELERMDTPALRERWQVLYGKEPPRLYRQFLIKRLAYRIQELAYGGLSDEARARMARVLDEEGYDDAGAKQGVARPKPDEGQMVPGTLLIREYDGVRHEVRVLDQGFEYRGVPYRSLSGVARAITGTAWNGPRFFGLRNTGAKTVTMRCSDAAAQ